MANLLNVKEVAKKLGVSRAQVYLMVKKGDFPVPIRIAKRTSRWLESDVDRWIERKFKVREKELAPWVAMAAAEKEAEEVKEVIAQSIEHEAQK